MTKFDQKRDELQAGEQLELEDFVDLEAARHPGYFDSKARLAAMDEDGVQCGVMYSEFDFTSKVYQIGDAWEECAISEIHGLADLGAPSIQIQNFPSELGMLDYHDKRYEKLWSAFEETGIVVANHLTLKDSLWDIFRRDPPPQKGIFTSLPGLAIAETLAWYILTGVLERHPKLRVVFVETGLFWLPGYIRFLDSRMDEHYDFPGVELKLSKYFQRQMGATFVYEPEAADQRYALGVENILWSTNFPHPACNWPGASSKIDTLF